MSGISKLKNKSFAQRTISGIILVIIALITIISGGDVLLFTICAISFVGVSELYRVFGIHKTALGFIGYFMTAVYYALLRFDMLEHLVPAAVFFLLFLMAAYVILFPKYRIESVMAAFFALFYVDVLLSCIYRVRMLENGIYLVWLIFVCSWGCDTCAYLVGVVFGKHKMAPVLSPKKSVEGGLGGVVGSALLGFVYVCIFGGEMSQITSPYTTVPAICAVAAVISQIGDLAASGIKRNYDIKDYGRLIPGHGGILDRFDSVMFTAPIIFYLVTYI